MHLPFITGQLACANSAQTNNKEQSCQDLHCIQTTFKRVGGSPLILATFTKCDRGGGNIFVFGLPVCFP